MEEFLIRIALIMFMAGAIELVMILQLIKLVMFFQSSPKKVTKKKPKEKVLWTENYPFEKGEYADWFQLGITDDDD